MRKLRLSYYCTERERERERKREREREIQSQFPGYGAILDTGFIFRTFSEVLKHNRTIKSVYCTFLIDIPMFYFKNSSMSHVSKCLSFKTWSFFSLYIFYCRKPRQWSWSQVLAKLVTTPYIIVYFAPSCASQPISLHRNLNGWPT